MADALTVPGDEEQRSKVERNYEKSIFVGNIPFESTAKDIEQIFSKDFDVVRADIVTRRGLSRGMATVEFSSIEDVEKAIAQFDRTEYQNREIFVRQDHPPPEEKRREPESRSTPAKDDDREPNPEVFVGNLPYSVSWQTLKDEFRSIGSIVRADILTDRSGRSRGYGTVVFRSTADAQAASTTALSWRAAELRFALAGKRRRPRPRKTLPSLKVSLAVVSPPRPFLSETCPTSPLRPTCSTSLRLLVVSLALRFSWKLVAGPLETLLSSLRCLSSLNWPSRTWIITITVAVLC